MSRCVNCALLLSHPVPNRQIREATDTMVNLLHVWISPTTVSQDDLICQECYILLERESGNCLRGIVPTQAFGHKQVCLCCGISILRAPTHKIGLNVPERSFILQNTPSHQAHRLERVCLRCWSNAYRNVRRRTELDHNRQALKRERESEIETTENMEICSTSRRNFVDISTSQMEVTLAPPLPPSAPSNPISQPIVHRPKIISHIYKRAAATSKHCIFSQCYSDERLLVPSAIKEILLLQHKLYVPRSARICSHHLHDGRWNELSFHYNDFTGLQMDDMMLIMERGNHRHFDFSNIREMDPHLCHYWLGMNADSFHQLLLHIPQLSQEVPCASTALCIMIIKLRTGDSNESLSSLFRISRRTLERYMSHVRNCLTASSIKLEI